jgi:hypothetical protein
MKLKIAFPKYSWPVWLLAGLTLLALLNSLPALTQADPVQVQVYDWWGRGYLVPILNDLSSALILVALVALLMRQTWSFSAFLAGVWIPAALIGAYAGIIYVNFDAYRAVLGTAAPAGGGMKMGGMPAMQFLSMGGLYTAVGAIFLAAALLTGLAFWKRGEIQGLE